MGQDYNGITLEQANEIAARIEKANIEHRELLDRQERITAQEILNGRSEAGIIITVDKEKEKIDEINAMLKHTGLHI